MARIGSSHYLSKGLSSIAGSSQGLLAYGLSFSSNDEHLNTAIVESLAPRLAVSLYGDPDSDANVMVRQAVDALVTRREAYRAKHPRKPALRVRYFDASSVSLWN